MITAIIEAGDDEVGLAHALAALVPAATEGVVRDVIVIDRRSDADTALIADAAGCVLIDAAAHHNAERAAVDEARGDWLFFVPQQTLPPEWQNDALAFIDRAMVNGRAQTQVAVFRGGRLPSGPIDWLRGFFRGGSPARLVAKSAWLAEQPRGAIRRSAVSSVSGARRGAA